MKFEYDPNKSLGNKDKHGLDFKEAQALWDDANGVVIAARSCTEPRYILIARRQGLYWSACFTWRSEAVRIISVRRARPEEVKFYEKNIR